MESSFLVPLGDINLLRLSASLGCDVSVEPRLSFCLFAFLPGRRQLTVIICAIQVDEISPLLAH